MIAQKREVTKNCTKETAQQSYRVNSNQDLVLSQNKDSVFDHTVLVRDSSPLPLIFNLSPFRKE